MIEVKLLEKLEREGKSRYWLAKQTGMTPLAISNICKGKTQGIDFTTLNVICNVLGCQPGDLLVHIKDSNDEDKQ